MRTPAGGWTRETLAKLGVPWPPPKGWRKQLIAESQPTETPMWSTKITDVVALRLRALELAAEAGGATEAVIERAGKFADFILGAASAAPTDDEAARESADKVA